MIERSKYKFQQVCESILETRIQQTKALTLPSDRHRMDILEAIEGIESFPKRLSAFQDYLIDLIATQNLKIAELENRIAEKDEIISLRTRSRHKHPRKIEG